MRTRKEKINFLKGMLKGQRRVSELLPVRFSVCFVSEKGDGTKEYLQDGKILSEEEYNHLPKGRTRNVTFNLQ